MERIRYWLLKNRMTVMAILTVTLFLAGCGRRTDGSIETSVEGTGESGEQTVPADAAEEVSGQFQYDEARLFDPELPVIEEEQALTEGRILLTLQPHLPNTWLKDAVDGFNRQSADYFIRLEDPMTESDEERLLAEIIAGRGPDIIAGNVLAVNESILKKGVLVDLAPELDAMGITDKEYFPAVRTLRMGDGVYGICPYFYADGLWIREAVLGSREQPDIETLVEKLYTYPDQEAVWQAGARSEVILEYLLCGSEDLWGMIDWEKGTCDFSGELFSKMLEIAKRYADPEKKTLEADERWLVSTYYPLWNPRKQLESEEKVIINYLFDDGNYPAFFRMGDTLMLNANTKHQEGAWEFLKYILGGEGQGYAGSGSDVVANREMTKSILEYRLQLLEEGRMQTTAVYTPETIEELLVFTGQARHTSLRTKEILDIIYEEAQAFCNGDKPLEEVRKIIQSRVGVYISENM